LKLSIIIVNYNVRYFLEQCLQSVEKAIQNIDAEVFVVDNNSPDDSIAMVKNQFPQVKIIANKINVGFSKANNQAIDQSKGEYVLLLNPDTVIEEDTFENCINFMDKNPNAGGLGVKMIDGNGKFLPESKRGLPTPSVSFYKISGLSTLFPKSKIFAKYHLGYLEEDKINEIEVLSGAFMFMRKSVLEITGYLDEAFFMYGEDIDLSYRIIKAGFKNYYYPKAKIIHYKGESTKKGSLNYVFVFYNAMIIFSKKHFAKKAKMFSFFINIAIYLRAFSAILIRFITRVKLPLNDVIITLLCILIVNYLKPSFGFPNQLNLTNKYNLIDIFIAVLPFSFGFFITKNYSKFISIKNTLHYFNRLKFYKNTTKKVILTGKENFVQKLKMKLEKSNHLNKIWAVKEDNSANAIQNYIGKLYQLPDLIDIYKINEVIFSSKDLKYKDMINEMSLSKNKDVDYKITLNSKFIIGSKTIEKIN